MKLFRRIGKLSRLNLLTGAACLALGCTAAAQQVTFAPYVQLGDNGTFGPADQIVIAWQTNETKPNASAYKVEFKESGARRARSVAASGRVVDNYLAADPVLPTIPTASVGSLMTMD